ncbi:MAG: class I SAM-dependent methyltransferase [Pseudomonadota bacterium]
MATASFWDKAAEKYAASPIKDMNAYEETLTRTRSYLRPTDHLLEIGCGTGSTALKLADTVAQITATDISGEMLRIAKGKAEKAGITNVSFERAVSTGQHHSAPFDAACAFSILHLVDDLAETLTHLRNEVKPGGYVISKTACLKDMNPLIRLAIKPMQWLGKAPHVLFFNAAELEQAFRDAGFEVVETSHFGKARAVRFVVARRPA